MDEKQKIEELKKIFSDTDFTMSLLEMETPEEVQKAVKAKGVDLSIEEINAVQAELANSDGEEMSDEQLDNVAGGFAITTAICAGIIGAAAIGAGVTIGRGVHSWTRGRW